MLMVPVLISGRRQSRVRLIGAWGKEEKEHWAAQKRLSTEISDRYTGELVIEMGQACSTVSRTQVISLLRL